MLHGLYFGAQRCFQKDTTDEVAEGKIGDTDGMTKACLNGEKVTDDRKGNNQLE